MNAIGGGLLLLFFLVITAVVLPAVLIWISVRIVGALFRLFGLGTRTIGRGGGALVRFVSGMVNDALSLVGGAVAAIIALILALTNLLLLRGKRVRHYFGSLEDELMAVVQCAYRLTIGHPLRLLGMGPALKSMEERMPSMMAGPATQRGPRRPSPPPTQSNTPGEEGEFEGYRILGALPPGGSGALLHVARPTQTKIDEMDARGVTLPDRVVIKAFSLGSGSTLPQIVRESRALEAAGRLGLVLEHNLDETSFHYVMPFIEGVTLDVTATQLHTATRDKGLTGSSLRAAMGHARDLARILSRFHAEGLWHKDIKPSNLIVGPTGLHVVDLGLVTPLASAMTLTTHGTEYYRDPELVRLAMKGVKVHQVDGAKFDIYGSGAVLYTLLEDAFPAHGSLSRFEKPSPKALQFVVRKAMAEMDSRYEAADHITRDLEFLMEAKDVWNVQPAQLPSFSGDLPSPARVTHNAPTASPYRTAGGSAWADPAFLDSDQGPVTRAARAAGWSSPPVRNTNALDRQGRRRRRRGPIKSLALAGLGVLSCVFYLALFKSAFHAPASTETFHQQEFNKPALANRELQLTGLDDCYKKLRPLPPGTPVLVAGGDSQYADEVRLHLKDNGFSPVTQDPAHSQAKRTDWLAGIEVQVGSSNLDNPDTRLRVKTWQRAQAPALRALIWLRKDREEDPQVEIFEPGTVSDK